MTAGGTQINADGLERALAGIRPLVLGHGGNIEIVDIDNGVVTVELTGACEACPNIAMTYAGPIRTFLLEVPGVSEVKCRRMYASKRTLDRIAHMLGARPFE
ncbi:MAG: NifU family protein [Mesorhizobium sp.]|nr:MAG: NifU family protein [Mesorhizobium sp.]